MTATRPAVLFDIDGTLIDSNYFHTVAWWRALQDAGMDIAMSRVHHLIGMGSDQLLQELLGEEREGLSDAHARHYAPFKPDLRAFPGASDLLRAVSKRGVQVVLATSSKEEDLDVLLEKIDADDAIEDIVHGDMVRPPRREPAGPPQLGPGERAPAAAERPQGRPASRWFRPATFTAPAATAHRSNAASRPVATSPDRGATGSDEAAMVSMARPAVDGAVVGGTAVTGAVVVVGSVVVVEVVVTVSIGA